MPFPRAPPRAHRPVETTESGGVRRAAGRARRAARDAADGERRHRRYRVRRERRSTSTPHRRRHRPSNASDAHAPDDVDARGLDNGALDKQAVPRDLAPNSPSNCDFCARADRNGARNRSRAGGMPGDEPFERLILSPGRESPHGKAGVFVQHLGFCSYFLFFAVPLLFVAIFFAIVPLGDPKNPEIGSQAVFLFCSNLAVMALFTFLYTATFLSFAERERPFRISLIPILIVVCIQVGVFAPVLLVNGTFDYMGIAALAVFYFSLYGGLCLAYRSMIGDISKYFRRFILLVALYIPLLVAYVIAYRESGAALQAFLAICIAFATFIYRRIMLSRLDPFPLHLAQLIAGFWVQNMSDIVQTLAFPQVNDPGVFAAIWLSNSFGNFAFLVFVSDKWIFSIRPKLKNAVLNGIKCNFPLPPIPEFDYSFDRYDRGHGPNVGGYRRRQFRFFFFRLLSQAVAMFLYLAISPVLRFGLNKEYTPLSSIGGDDYRNSMIYAAVNLIFIFFIAFLGYSMLRAKHHRTYHEVRELHRDDINNHTRVGLIIAIISHNLVLAIGVILSQYCIYAGFRSCVSKSFNSNT